MNEYVKGLLSEAITQIRSSQPVEHKYSVDYYIKDVLRRTIGTSEEAYRAACEDLWKQELWKKPIVYFIAVIINKEKDLNSHRDFENKCLGDMPSEIVI